MARGWDGDVCFLDTFMSTWIKFSFLAMSD